MSSLKSPAAGKPATEEEVRAGSRRLLRLKATIALLRGDLDWIVMKCLEKDRTRRYNTANGLAMDIQRHLSCEPVLARPPSAAYRLQKAYRRNRLVFAAGTAVVVALVVGLGMAATGWRHAMKERNSALTARAGEEAQRREAQKAQASESELRRRAQTEELAARRRAYASDMNQVQQALAINNLGRAQMLLDRQKPGPAQPDLRGWEWRYLWGQTRADEHQVFFSGTSEEERLSFSADGRLLMRRGSGGHLVVTDVASRRPVLDQSGSSVPEFGHRTSLLAFARSEGAVVLWDFSTQREVQRLPVSLRSVHWILFTPDDRQLLTVSGRTNLTKLDNERLLLTAWEVSTGTQLWQRPLSVADSAMMGRRYTVSPDGTAVAAALADHRFAVINIKDGTERFVVKATDEQVTALAFSSDSSTLLSGAGFTDSTIRLWDARDGKPLGSLDGHRSWVSDLLFTPDGKQLASASGDQTVRLWDWSTRKATGVLRGHLGEVLGIAMSPGGRTLASTCKDGSIYLWELDRSTARSAYRTLPVPGDRAVFTPDSRSMIVSESGGGLARWDVESLRETRRWLERATNHQTSVRISADATQAALFEAKGCLRILDLASGDQRTNLVGNHDVFDKCWFANNGKLLITGTSDEERRIIHSRVWDTKSWRSTGTVQFKDGSETTAEATPARSLFFNYDGRKVLVWDLSRLAEAPRTLAGGSGQPAGGEVSPDGQTVAMAYENGHVRLWNLETQQSLGMLRGFLLGVHSVTFSPDGRRLAAGSNGLEAMKLWDTESWQELLTLAGEGSRFASSAFSADGRILMAINDVGLVHLWFAPSWEEIAAAEAKEKTEIKQP